MPASFPLKTLSLLGLALLTAGALIAQEADEAPAPAPSVDALGDALPRHASGRLGTQRLRHGGPVVALAFSSDGAQIMSAGLDQNIHIWEAEGGALVQSFTGHEGPIQAMSLSWRDWLIASGSVDRTLRLWEPEAGVLLKTLRGHVAPIEAVAFDSIASAVASAGRDRRIRLHDPVTGGELLTLTAEHPLLDLAFHPEEEHLAASDTEGRVQIWDLDSGQVLRTLTAHTGPVSTLAYHPDSATLASGGDDHRVHIWEGDAPRLTLTGHTGAVTDLAFSPDGLRIASASRDGSVRVWSTEDGALIQTFTGHTGPVNTVAFHPEGARLASGGDDHRVRVWALEDAAEALTFDAHDSSVLTLAVAGTTAATAGADHAIRLWDARSGALRHTLSGHDDRVHALHFQADGRRLASASEDGEVQLWRLPEGGEPERGVTYTAHTGPVLSVRIAPDGARVASGGADGVHLWAADGGATLARIEHPATVTAAAFTSEGRTLAVGGHRDAIALWRLPESGEPERIRELDAHRAGVLGLDISPDDALLASAGRDGAVRVFSLSDGALLHTLEGHIGYARDVRFAPDGEVLVSAGEDGSVRLWDLETGGELMRAVGHPCAVSCLDFGGEGELLISGSEDATALVWTWSELRHAGQQAALPPLLREGYTPPKMPGQHPLAGAAAPELEGVVELAGGAPVTLAAHQGSVVLIDFWATWCGPCRMTLPHLSELHERYREQGLIIIGLSEEDPLTLQSFVTQTPLPYLVARDEGGATNARYQVSGLPTLFLIGRDGAVERVFVGAGQDEALERAVQKALREK